METIHPLLVELRSELFLPLDAALERVRCLELQMPNKMDKEFLDAFFRKIRQAVQETNDRVSSLQSAMADRAQKEDAEEKADDARAASQLGEANPRGRTAVTCLVCGSKRPVTMAPGIGITRRGHVYKGRVPIGSTPQPDYDNAALPPLRVEE
jgi:hypothetical protein